MMLRWGVEEWNQRRERRYRERRRVEGEGGCKQETCFEILIRGSGCGLVHRDEKKKKGRGTFEARECSLHL